MYHYKTINAALLSLVVFDTLLVVVAFAFPDMWFLVFHATAEATPGAELFLKRCGANWAAFALFQGIAYLKWDSQPFWLAVVAGLRLGDIFTDITYVVFAEDPTLLAMLALPTAGIVNIGLGWYFLSVYRDKLTQGAVAERES